MKGKQKLNLKMGRCQGHMITIFEYFKGHNIKKKFVLPNFKSMGKIKIH
jgi:hypothetical protein